VADEEGMPAGAHPVAPDLRQHVMRHMLLVEDPLPAPSGSGDVRRHRPPVRLVVSQDLLPHRMLGAGDAEVGGIERLVGHCAVRTVAERPHQGCGKVAWAGPHGDPYRPLACIHRDSTS
jgi:hypothetical protein